MQTIWKFKVPPGPLLLPRSMTVLSVALVDNEMFVWALAPKTPNASPEKQEVRTYNTGATIPDDPGRFLGTVRTTNGIVWHAFVADSEER